MQKKRKIWLLILMLLGVDLLSKYVFYDMRRGEDFLFLKQVFNTGISWGIAVWQPLILVVSVIGVSFFCYLLYKKYISIWVFMFLLAGTLGNMIDRIFLGGVRDFVSIWTFPVFNMADCYLTVGVIILLRNEIFPCNCNQKP